MAQYMTFFASILLLTQEGMTKAQFFYTINQQIVLIEQKANFFLVKTIVAATAFHNLAKYAAVYDHLINEIQIGDM